MIKITVPKDNIAERNYIIDVIFEEFLGLDYTIEFKENISEWKIELENGGKIIIEDHFFNRFQNDYNYNLR